MSSVKADPEIYQLRLNIKGISPMIWRRLLVRSDSTLADLHYVIQIAMNWSNYYLHRFTIRGKNYIGSRLHHAEGRDAAEVSLHHLKLRLNERFLYEYSFFEWWEHELRLEKRLPCDGKKVYPICIGGARAAPQEDWGGAEGFMQRQEHFSTFYMADRLVEITKRYLEGDFPDQDDREFYQAELRAFDYWMNVEKFDRRDVNRRLKWYGLGDERWAEYLEVL